MPTRKMSVIDPNAQPRGESACSRMAAASGKSTGSVKVRKAAGTGDKAGTAPATIPATTRPVNKRAPSGARHTNKTDPAAHVAAANAVPAIYRWRHAGAAAASGFAARKRRVSRERPAVMITNTHHPTNAT